MRGRSVPRAPDGLAQPDGGLLIPAAPVQKILIHFDPTRLQKQQDRGAAVGEEALFLPAGDSAGKGMVFDPAYQQRSHLHDDDVAEAVGVLEGVLPRIFPVDGPGGGSRRMDRMADPGDAGVRLGDPVQTPDIPVIIGDAQPEQKQRAAGEPSGKRRIPQKLRQGVGRSIEIRSEAFRCTR